MTEKTFLHSLPESQKPLSAVAEPAPLGLIGLAIAALVLASADLGLTSSTSKSLMIPWTLFLGGTAQLIAGVMDYKRGNVFGATTFTTYSFLWYSVSLTLILTLFYDIEFDVAHYAFGLLGFFMFSIILTVASVMTNKIFFIILIFIDLAILLLVSNILIESPVEFVGGSLLMVSLFSFYGAAGILLNTMTGKNSIPLGKALWKPAK